MPRRIYCLILKDLDFNTILGHPIVIFVLPEHDPSTNFDPISAGPDLSYSLIENYKKLLLVINNLAKDTTADCRGNQDSGRLGQDSFPFCNELPRIEVRVSK